MSYASQPKKLPWFLSSALIVGTLGSGDLHALPIGWSITSDGTNELHRIDLATGIATPVGLTGGDVEGLAFDPTSGILYGIDDDEDSLVRISTTTGAATPIGSLGIPAGQTNAGLGIDINGRAYMADQDGNDIYNVNLTTGAAVLVGNTGLGGDGIDGLAFIGTTLYGVSTNNDTLYTVNLATAAVAPVGTGLGVNVVQESGLAYDGSSLWAVDDSGAIFRINPATGVGTFVAQTLTFEGLAIRLVPEPATILLLTTSVFLLFGRRGYLPCGLSG